MTTQYEQSFECGICSVPLAWNEEVKRWYHIVSWGFERKHEGFITIMPNPPAQSQSRDS